VAVLSMVFCECNVTPAMRSICSPSVAPTVGALGERRGFCPSCGARRMAESAALLVDEVLPNEPMRQWVLSVPFPLRFLFVSQPKIMGKALSIVYRTIATHLTRKAGYTITTAHTGAVTLIQRFGSALNLNVHLMCMDARMPRAHGCAGAAHMIFLARLCRRCQLGKL
jgi:CheY-like chemotaxis protein